MSSLRHSTLPVPALRHESTPAAPSVQTLPSATAGDERVPGNRAAGPCTAAALYLSCHTCLPLVTSRQVVTSSSPWRAKANSLSPTSAGVDTPSPTSADHFFVNSLGQVAGVLKSATLASRLTPRHCGQSAARDDDQSNTQTTAAGKKALRIGEPPGKRMRRQHGAPPL